MGREHRARRDRALVDVNQRREFQRKAPLLYPVIAFVSSFIVSSTTGTQLLSRIERLALWLIVLVEIVRQFR